MSPFKPVFHDARQHGIVVGVALPGTAEPVPDPVLERLHPAEQAYARTLRGFRQPEWVGARIAAREALRILGAPPVAVLNDDRGAPRLDGADPGVALSLAHKRDLAIALVARSGHGSIGVDLEDLQPERSGVATRVLTARELGAVESLPPERRWTAIVVRFSIKEAIYKALAPTLGRYIAFDEAEVDPTPDGLARVTLHLARGEPTPAISARYAWLHGRVLSTVRARWA
ncbi:MAG: 4'-phosphopantetheinyl transferase superfamily protein [Deltaproteobacteria bacterium]|nr:MAG: 4'-phosphopantetheinyl transferase superfamily protein [Deltaproteobacteria bacterium]